MMVQLTKYQMCVIHCIVDIWSGNSRLQQARRYGDRKTGSASMNLWVWSRGGVSFGFGAGWYHCERGLPQHRPRAVAARELDHWGLSLYVCSRHAWGWRVGAWWGYVGARLFSCVVIGWCSLVAPCVTGHRAVVVRDFLVLLAVVRRRRCVAVVPVTIITTDVQHLASVPELSAA